MKIVYKYTSKSLKFCYVDNEEVFGLSGEHLLRELDDLLHIILMKSIRVCSLILWLHIAEM